MNETEAHNYIEKNFVSYYLFAAIITWTIIMFLAILTANVFPNYKLAILAVGLTTSSLASIVLPMYFDFYWKALVKQKMKE